MRNLIAEITLNIYNFYDKSIQPNIVNIKQYINNKGFVTYFKNICKSISITLISWMFIGYSRAHALITQYILEKTDPTDSNIYILKMWQILDNHTQNLVVFEHPTLHSSNWVGESTGIYHILFKYKQQESFIKTFSLCF